MSFADLIASVDRTALAVFGEPAPVVYAPSVGAPVPVTGIFDEQYVLAKGDAESGVEVVGPAVFLRLEDLPADPRDPDEDPTITIRGVAYEVHGRAPDGMGGIVLALRRAT